MGGQKAAQFSYYRGGLYEEKIIRNYVVNVGNYSRKRFLQSCSPGISARYILEGQAGGPGIGPFSPDGSKVITTSTISTFSPSGGTVYIWDTHTGKRIDTLKVEEKMLGASWSPDGKSVLVKLTKDNILWDVSHLTE